MKELREGISPRPRLHQALRLLGGILLNAHAASCSSDPPEPAELRVTVTDAQASGCAFNILVETTGRGEYEILGGTVYARTRNVGERSFELTDADAIDVLGRNRLSSSEPLTGFIAWRDDVESVRYTLRVKHRDNGEVLSGSAFMDCPEPAADPLASYAPDWRRVDRGEVRQSGPVKFDSVWPRATGDQFEEYRRRYHRDTFINGPADDPYSAYRALSGVSEAAAPAGPPRR